MEGDDDGKGWWQEPVDVHFQLATILKNQIAACNSRFLVSLTLTL